MRLSDLEKVPPIREQFGMEHIQPYEPDPFTPYAESAGCIEEARVAVAAVRIFDARRAATTTGAEEKTE